MAELRTLSRMVVLAAIIFFAYGGLARSRPPQEHLPSEKRPSSAKAILREELAARIAERRRLPMPSSTARAASGPTCESTGFEATEATCQWEQGWICGSTFTWCVSDHDIPQVCTGDPIVDENCCADNPNPLNGWYVSNSSQHCNEPHVEAGRGVGGSNSLRFQRDPGGGESVGGPYGTVTGCTGLNSACRVSAFTPSAGPQPIGPTTISFDLSSPQFISHSLMNYFTMADSENTQRGLRIVWSAINTYIYVYNPATHRYDFVYFMDTTYGTFHHYEINVDPCNDVITYKQDCCVFHLQDFTGLALTVERAVFTHDNAGTHAWDLDNYTVTRGEPCPGGACCDLVAGSCVQVESADDCSGQNMVFSEGKDCESVDCTAITAACCDSSPGAGGACSDTTLADCAVSDQVTWSKGVSCSDGLCAETPGACCDTGPGQGGACTEVLQAECPEGTQVSWTKGLSCADAGCVETTGACCNTLEGTCTDDILSTNCEGTQRRWNKGATCAEVSCNAVLGACCDTGAENPTIASCSQTTQAECNCAKCTWYKRLNCDAIVCDPNFDPIPTVSQWGMAIMTLLLLAAGKVHFSRRYAWRRSDSQR